MSNPIPFHNASSYLEKNDTIMLDTSFVLHHSGYNDNNLITQNCKDFTLASILAKSFLTISVVTMGELRNVLFTDEMMVRGLKNTERTRKDLARNNPNLYDEIHNAVDTKINIILAALKALPNFLANPVGSINFEIDSIARNLQLKYRMPGPNDALMVAIALSGEANGIATTDSDFYNISEDKLKILVDSKTYDKRNT